MVKNMEKSVTINI